MTSPSTHPPPPRRWWPRLAIPIAILLTSAVALGAHLARSRSGPDPGDQLPALTLPMIYGNAPQLSTEALLGRVVLVEIFASWCGYCEKATSEVSSAALARRARPVTFLGVSVDETPQEAAQATTRWGIPFDVAWDDGRLADTWNVRSLPTLVLLDERGLVLWAHAGLPGTEALEDALAEAGAQRLE